MSKANLPTDTISSFQDVFLSAALISHSDYNEWHSCSLWYFLKIANKHFCFQYLHQVCLHENIFIAETTIKIKETIKMSIKLSFSPKTSHGVSIDIALI